MYKNHDGTYSTALNLGHEHEHELILVHPRTHPKDDCGCDHNKRRERCKDQPHGAHKQLHAINALLHRLYGENLRCLNNRSHIGTREVESIRGYLEEYGQIHCPNRIGLRPREKRGMNVLSLEREPH